MNIVGTIEVPLAAEDKSNVKVIFRCRPEDDINVCFSVLDNEVTVKMFRYYSGMPIDAVTASDHSLMFMVKEIEELTSLRFIPCDFPSLNYMVFVRIDVLEEMGIIAPLNYAMPA